MPNPFFSLQSRIRDLLAAAEYFAGLREGQLLTEEVGNLANQVETVLIPLGFGVVITTAAGKPIESSYEALVTLEDLNVSITHNPQNDPAHNLTDALFAAVDAIHGASVQATPPAAARPHDFFAIVGHQKRLDGPQGCGVHELHVQAGLRLR